MKTMETTSIRPGVKGVAIWMPRKVLAISIVLSALSAFVVGLCWSEFTAHATGGGEPTGNGDVNGDGAITISDAVYILNWLFKAGDAPVPIPADKELPATGQKWAIHYGDDGFYEAGCPMAGRFVDNGDGTVTDNCTGLMWQKATERGRNWWEAIAYCEDLNFAGHSDWRLPNVLELQSIVDYGRSNPASDPVFGSDSFWYWASTSNINNPDYAWKIQFGGGYIGGDGSKSIRGLLFRAVRTVQPGD